MKIPNKIFNGLLILLIFTSFQKPVQNKITESEVYNFLNEVIPTLTGGNNACDAISEEPILNIPVFNFNNTTLEKTLKNYRKNKWIKRKDIDFILSQQDDTAFVFEENKIHKRIIYEQTLDSIFSIPNSHGYYTLQTEYNINCYGRISKPFFTTDKNTAIIVYEVSCDYEYGGGYIIIYKRIKGKWTVLELINTWIS